MASQNPNHKNSLYPSIDVSDLAEDLVPDNTSPSAPSAVTNEIQWPLAKDEASVKVDSKVSKRMNDAAASSASGGSSFTGFDVGSTTSIASLGTRFSFAIKPSTPAVSSFTAPAFGGEYYVASKSWEKKTAETMSFHLLTKAWRQSQASKQIAFSYLLSRSFSQ
ncbi:hypothetical protein SESBI_48052 [Sesbania bispinosa]|nr:hypothetical protein SESBI_48052 [Sesbania bispinosa]